MFDMPQSLHNGEIGCQRDGDYRLSARLLWAMAHAEDDRKALGDSLAAARRQAGFTLESAATALTQAGYPITKQGVGHWESGRNVPDALWLRRLASLYETSVDSLIGCEKTHSPGAVMLAKQFDSLDRDEKHRARMLWDAFYKGAKKQSQSGESSNSQPARDLKQAVA